MLPIFKNRQQGPASTGLSVKVRTPDEKPESSEDDPKAAMRSCAMDLHKAFQAGDYTAAADALQAAFELADKAPHEEGPHIEPHSYDSQNQKED